jgi:endonuclease/exonuclease/phosphatase family metal-dependent hydrolase
MKFIFTFIAILLTIKASAQENQALKIITFNIRYDNPDDGANSWENRKEEVFTFLNKEKPDLWGGQEVLHHQLQDILIGLPEYDFIGVGRENGKTKGEYSPIFFDKSKISLVRNGTFWLSNTPNKVASVGWDAALERITTWGIFTVKATGQEVAVFNTHFDHVGKIARMKSADLILKKIKEIAKDKPIVLMGDFNVTENSEALEGIKDSPGFSLAKKMAGNISGPDWSFHDFGDLPMNKRNLIDHIFVNQCIKVLDYHNIFEKQDAPFLSDHNPIMINVLIDCKHEK